MKKTRKIFTRDFAVEMILEFFIVTACVCILNGVVGVLFLPEDRFGYEAYLSPPFFGLCSVLCGIVLESTREISTTQMMIRKLIHLLLIEFIVFGLNYQNGHVFGKTLTIVLVVGIAVVYIAVSVIMYLNNRRSARQFNEELRRFQMERGEEP